MAEIKKPSERELVQIDLSGETVHIKEETKFYESYAIQGYKLRVESAIHNVLASRVSALEDKHPAPEIKEWKVAYIHNKIKALPFKPHPRRQLTKFADDMENILFDGADIPTDMTHASEEINYIEFDTAKFTIRVKKDVYEKKRAKWIKWLSGKSTAKKQKADEQINEFINRKMRQKKSVYATEGEANGYSKKFREAMLKDVPMLAEGQKELEV